MKKRFATVAELASFPAVPSSSRAVIASPRAAFASPLAAIASSLAVLALLVAGCGKHEPGALARIRAAGVLRWGGDLAGGEPYVYEDPQKTGRLIGFEVDLASAIARELGVRAEFQQNEWSQLVPSLERGGFDLLLNGFEVTKRHAARVSLTLPYYAFVERLMVRGDDPRMLDLARGARREHAARSGELPALADLAHVADLHVGTLANSFAADLLREAGIDGVLLYDGVDTPYTDLVLGRSDAVLLDDIISDRYGAVHKELAAVADFAPGYYAAAVAPRDVDLRAAVDAALARIARSGELRRILERYHLWNEREASLAERLDHFPRALLDAPGKNVTLVAPRLDFRGFTLFVEGAGYTLLVSLFAMAIAVPLGVGLALARLFGGRGLRAAAGLYVELYRGTPVLLQLYLIYFGLADYVRLGPVEAAVVGLGMNYAAYEAEVYRGAMNGVPRGQLEAALAIGMSLGQALRRVLLPQALRLALPSVTNDFIALLKDSSLVSVITVVELTKRSQIAAVETGSWLVPGLLCAALYFAMSYPLSQLARVLETRLARA